MACQALPVGTWLTVTGHFDDAAASTCSGGPAGGTPADAVLWCREQFVVTGARRTDAPARELPGRWAVIPPAPIGRRSGAAVAWTGSRLLVWGGWAYDSSRAAGLRRGALFDPTTSTWTLTSAAPFAGRASPAFGWTGDRLLVWGGTGDGGALADGAAYDPATDLWTKLPAGPLAADDTPVAAWTGRELVVITSGATGSSWTLTGTPAAAAFDPAAGTWRMLPAPPLPAGLMDATWTGSELVVIAFRDGAAESLAAAALDPRAGTWRAIVAPPYDGQWLGQPLTWTGTELIFGRVAWEPSADTWRTLAATDCSGTIAGAWSGTLSFSPTQAYDPVADRCRTLPARAIAGFGPEDGSMLWAGDRVLAWPRSENTPLGQTPPADGLVFVPKP